MKVFVVYTGEYSDRSIRGIFSTKEKAQEAIQVIKDTDKWDCDSVSDPIEYELDSFLPPNEVVFVYDETKGTWELGYGNLFIDGSGFYYDEEDKHYYVSVNYNPNKEVMLKAARDYYMMFRAEKVRNDLRRY